MGRIVVTALGAGVLSPSRDEDETLARQLASLVADGFDLVITRGHPDEDAMHAALLERGLERVISTFVTHPVVRDAAPRGDTARSVGIIEAPVVRGLAEQGVIVIDGESLAPSVRRGQTLTPVHADVDPVEAAAALALSVGADVLVLGAESQCLEVKVGPRRTEPVHHASALQVREWLSTGMVRPMRLVPQVEVACNFAERVPGTMAVLTDRLSVTAAIAGRAGTTIQA